MKHPSLTSQLIAFPLPFTWLYDSLIILFKTLISFNLVKWVMLLTETQKHCLKADVPLQWYCAPLIFRRTPVQHCLEIKIFQVVFSVAEAWFTLQWLSVIQHAAGQKWYRADRLIDLSVAFFEHSQMWSSVSDKLWLEVKCFQISFVPPLLYSVPATVLSSSPFLIKTWNISPSSNYAGLRKPQQGLAFGCYSNNALCLTLPCHVTKFCLLTLHCRRNWPLVCLISLLNVAIIHFFIQSDQMICWS